MAKNRHGAKPAPGIAPSGKPHIPLPPVPAGTMPPNFDPKGPGEQMDVVASRDGWSEYTLDDGTKVRLKASLIDVKKAISQYSQDGNPIYFFQFTVINQVIVPDNLRKKG